MIAWNRRRRSLCSQSFPWCLRCSSAPVPSPAAARGRADTIRITIVSPSRRARKREVGVVR